MLRRLAPALLAVLACLAFAAPAPPPSPAGEPPTVSGLDVTRGNLMGGTSVTLSVTHVVSAQETRVLVGNKPAEIVAVVPGASITILTPGVSEPSGQAVDVCVQTKDGKAVLEDAFTYTPTLHVSLIGSAAAGGGLVVSWQTEGLDPGALMTVWVGDPAHPDLGDPLPGYAGVLYEEPGLEFVSTLASDAGYLLHFPSLPAAIVGFPLHLQGLATKEGAHKGSFTNVATFALP